MLLLNPSLESITDTTIIERFEDLFERTVKIIDESE